MSVDLLRRAGVRRGMRLLNLGCGAGDMTFAAAEVVGSSGTVFGIDTSAEAIVVARARANAVQARNVRFERRSLEPLDPPGSIDALVGRLVLMRLQDPAAVLRSAVAGLPPGGIVAFLEMNVSVADLQTTFQQGGVSLDFGAQVHAGTPFTPAVVGIWARVPGGR